MLRRPGLSRVEFLTILLITLLAGASILTAIGRLREAGARMGCHNNLKQIILGVHQYDDATGGRLPPLSGNDPRSVVARLAPFLEASHRMYSPGKAPAAAYHAHSTVPFPFTDKLGAERTQYGGDANQTWRLFLDPADWTAQGLRDVPITLPDGTTGHYASGSYVINGLLPWGSDDKPRWALALLAECIVFTERPQVCRTAMGEPVHNIWGVGFYSPHMPAFAALAPTDSPSLQSTGQAAPITPLPDEGTADRDAHIRLRIGRMDSAPQPSDFLTPVQLLRRGQPCDPRLPGSPHRGGMQAAMGDGSVRVFGPDTSPWVFWSACMPGAPARTAAGE